VSFILGIVPNKAPTLIPHKYCRQALCVNFRLYVHAGYRISSSIMRIVFFHLWFILIVGLGVSTISSAADFRVENRIYSGDNTEPSSQSCTVFHQGLVYDFLQNPSETIVFDKAAGRFVILDDRRQIRTELSTTELDRFARQLKDRAGQGQDPLMQFLAEPVFDERFDQSRRELTLVSKSVTYKAIVASAENAAIATQYREFSDWYARLNAMLIPGSRPPFARLKLNEALARREAVAREVTLTINTVKDGKVQASTVRSDHHLSLELTPDDMERIQHARHSMTGYKLVSFDKYRQAN